MKKKVEVYKILKITAGGFHAWCESNIGKIRKPLNNINVSERTIKLGDKKVKVKVEKLEPVSLELKWYQRLWNWFKGRFVIKK